MLSLELRKFDCDALTEKSTTVVFGGQHCRDLVTIKLLRMAKFLENPFNIKYDGESWLEKTRRKLLIIIIIINT